MVRFGCENFKRHFYVASLVDGSKYPWHKTSENPAQDLPLGLLFLFYYIQVLMPYNADYTQVCSTSQIGFICNFRIWVFFRFFFWKYSFFFHREVVRNCVPWFRHLDNASFSGTLEFLKCILFRQFAAGRKQKDRESLVNVLAKRCFMPETTVWVRFHRNLTGCYGLVYLDGIALI